MLAGPGLALTRNRTRRGLVSAFMGAFGRSTLDAAAKEREVTLTTVGRKTGKRRPVTIWISTDGERLYIRSGEGLGRDWPQNLLALGAATLRFGGPAIKGKPRHVTAPQHARHLAPRS